MTWLDETTESSGQAAAGRAGERRPLSVAMVTRRSAAEIGGVERVVALLLAELPRARPAWRVEAVSAFRRGSRIEGMDGLSDLIAALRLGWRLRRSAADVAFVNCPECLWGIRLLRRRPAARRWSRSGTAPAPSATCASAGPGTR